MGLRQEGGVLAEHVVTCGERGAVAAALGSCQLQDPELFILKTELLKSHWGAPGKPPRPYSPQLFLPAQPHHLTVFFFLAATWTQRSCVVSWPTFLLRVGFVSCGSAAGFVPTWAGQGRAGWFRGSDPVCESLREGVLGHLCFPPGRRGFVMGVEGSSDARQEV